MKPNESLLKAHVEGASFQAGADIEKWGIHGSMEAIDWTLPIIWVRADRRIIQSGRAYLRFNTENYPQQAPTACPWDINANSVLAPGSWPKGGNVSTVFNPAWNSQALYAPCDRVAMAGHDAWRALCPQWWWQSNFTIVRYLEFVHVCLNPADYENN